ncbi:hypothetical protein [Ectothiorhodospira haloalkaliphila]|nr:hypothetical protein [Ectothiorhodospira haloalkaliphila]
MTLPRSALVRTNEPPRNQRGFRAFLGDQVRLNMEKRVLERAA